MKYLVTLVPTAKGRDGRPDHAISWEHFSKAKTFIGQMCAQTAEYESFVSEMSREPNEFRVYLWVVNVADYEEEFLSLLNDGLRFLQKGHVEVRSIVWLSDLPATEEKTPIGVELFREPVAPTPFCARCGRPVVKDLDTSNGWKHAHGGTTKHDAEPDDD